MKCFPKTYLEYMDKVATKKKSKQSALLLQVIQKAKNMQTKDDYVKMLEKVKDKIRKEIDAY